MTSGPRGSLGTARLLLPRRLAVAALAVIAVAGVLLSLPLLAVAALAFLVAVGIVPPARDGRPWLSDVLAWLPLAAVLLFCTTTAVVVLSSLLSQPLWGDGRGSATLIGLTIVLAGVASVRGGAIGLWSPGSLLAWSPALALTAVHLFRFHQPMSYWSRPVWGLTDWVNNAEMVVDLYKHGWLEYASSAQSAGGPVTVYPRGLHALIAWLVAGATDTDTTAQAWVGAVTGVSVAVAVITVLALASSSLVALAVARRLGAPGWVLVVAPLLTSLLMLHPTVYGVLGRSGFMTSGAATVVLFALLLAVDAGRSDGGFQARVITAAALTVAMFYVWQLLVLPVAAIGVYLVARWWRTGRRRPAWVVSAVLLAALAFLPLARVSASAAGAAQAELGASLGTAPLALVAALSVLAVAVLLVARPRTAPLGTASVVALGSTLLLCLALVVALEGSLTAIPYYADKVAWQAGVLALPIAIAAGCYLTALAWQSAWLARVTGQRTSVRVAVVGIPSVLIAAYAGGWLSFGLTTSITALPSPGGPSPQVAMAVLTSSGVQSAGGRPVLPWMLHPQGWQLWLRYDDWHAAQILRTLGSPVPEEFTLLSHRADAACRWLEGHPDAIRLTGPRLGYRDLLERGCPADVVRPELWEVVTTPPEWWADTRWESTGGAPDPAITIPPVLLGRGPTT